MTERIIIMPQFVKLSTLCKIKYGKDHKKLSTGFVPVYGSGGVMRYVNEALYDKASVLIPRKGTLGNLFYVDKPFWTVDTLFWTDIDTTKVLPRFLYYSLKIKDLANLNVGTAVPSLTTSVLNDVEIYLPSLREQQRIVNILASLDDKIELNRKMNENLEQQAAALFKHWFVDFEFPDANGNPYRSSGGKMEESSLGKIPEDWGISKLSSVIDFNPTVHLPRGVITKRIAMDKLIPYSKNIAGYDVARFKGGAKFMNGDTLLARITPCLENGKIAYVNFLRVGEKAFGSTEYIVMRGKKDGVTNEFVYCLASSARFRDVAIQSMVGSSGRQRVQQSVLENYLLAIPPQSILKKFSYIVNGYDLLMSNNSTQSVLYNEQLNILIRVLLTCNSKSASIFS